MQGKVEICSVNTARLPRLSGEETEDLLRKARDGDRDAREKLISGNLRLVLSVIQKFAGRGENADDLFQVGCVGLIKAIDNFDPSHEVRFSTYGVPTGIRCGKSRRGKIKKAVGSRASNGFYGLSFRFVSRNSFTIMVIASICASVRPSALIVRLLDAPRR